MKFKFTPTSVFSPEWNGNRDLPESEQITMTLSVLNMGDLLNLMDTIESHKDGNDSVDSDSLDVSTVKEIVSMANELLPKYVTDFKGLESDDGPIGLDTLCKYPQFMNLVVEITFELINKSTPDEEDSKNLEGSSSSADGQTATS
jgi:hypothetical protein